MRILFFDYISPLGHKKFDKIHIESLIRTGVEITLLGKSNQFDDIDKSWNLHIKIIPKWVFSAWPLRPFTGRLKKTICLLWVRLFGHINNYDCILFPTYDVMSLLFFRTRKNVVVINHNNVSQLDNVIKLLFTKMLPKHYIHVAISRDMEKRLKFLLPNRKIVFIPHGVCPTLEVTKKPCFIDEGDKFLFCPVNRNFDKEEIRDWFDSSELNDFLDFNKVTLYVKEMILPAERRPMIKAIDRYLNVKEYNYMLQNAIAVILPYDRHFKYRCSGILFESVAYNTPIITTEIESMLAYKDFLQISFFKTSGELIKCIDKVINSKRIETDLSPFSTDVYWIKLLKIL